MPIEPPILITGHARSGTSLVAGMLAAAGAWTGECVPGGAPNPRGFFENIAIRETIVKRLLAEINCDPLGVQKLPAGADTLALEPLAVRLLIDGSMLLEGYPGGPRLYKDAKLTLLWSVFDRAFPGAKWVIVQRDAKECVASCMRTDFMRQHSNSIDFWEKWYTDYHARHVALAETVGPERCRLLWSSDIVAGEYEPMRELADWCGLEWSDEIAERFIIPEAWHDSPAGQDQIFAKVTLNTEDTTVVDHVTANCALGLPQVTMQQAHANEVCIVGGGPSLRDSLGSLKSAHENGISIVACNGAHNWLLDQEIVPNAMVLMDAREDDRNVEFVSRPSHDCVYFIASAVDPRVYAALDGHDVHQWHVATRNFDFAAVFKDAGIPLDTKTVYGGSSIGVKAIALLMMMGFRRFHLFGVDGCVRELGEGEDVTIEHHAYEQTLNDGDEYREIFIGGKRFLCTVWMVRQLEDFKTLVDQFGNVLQISIHGDSALSELVHEAVRDSDRKSALLETLAEEDAHARDGQGDSGVLPPR